MTHPTTRKRQQRARAKNGQRHRIVVYLNDSDRMDLSAVAAGLGVDDDEAVRLIVRDRIDGGLTDV